MCKETLFLCQNDDSATLFFSTSLDKVMYRSAVDLGFTMLTRKKSRNIMDKSSGSSRFISVGTSIGSESTNRPKYLAAGRTVLWMSGFATMEFCQEQRRMRPVVLQMSPNGNVIRQHMSSQDEETFVAEHGKP